MTKRKTATDENRAKDPSVAAEPTHQDRQTGPGQVAVYTIPRGPVHLYFLTSTGEVRSLERYRWRNGEWRSALTGCVPRMKVSKWEGEHDAG